MLAFMIALLCLAGGCQRQVAVRVDQRLPAAVVEPAARAVELHLDAALTTHVYSENTAARAHWRIDSGAAQADMFRRIIGDLFTAVSEVPGTTTSSGLRLTPRLVALQFATPEETGLDYFECWIAYEIALSGDDGDELPPWHFSGYGQAPAARFGGLAAGLEGALADALRNAGARLATGFRDHPPVRHYLAAGAPP